MYPLMKNLDKKEKNLGSTQHQEVAQFDTSSAVTGGGKKKQLLKKKLEVINTQENAPCFFVEVVKKYKKLSW